MGNLRTLLKSEIDLENIVFIPSGGGRDTDSTYEISPQEFLKLAKENFRQGNLIDTISNAKRSIDCEIDGIFEILGVNTDKNKALEGFIKNFTFNNNIPFKLKVLEALDLAPSFLISEVRKIRHNLEHNYQTPEVTDVKRALDVAELTIKSVGVSSMLLNKEFYITDKKNYGKGSDECLGFLVGLSIQFNETEKIFEMSLQRKDGRVENFNITPDSTEYYALLRLMNCIEDEYEANYSFGIAIKE